MEWYISRCPDCKKSYSWTGRKTFMFLKPEELEAEKRKHEVCKFCGSENLKTELDFGDNPGTESAKIVAEVLGNLMSGKEPFEGMDEHGEKKAVTHEERMRHLEDEKYEICEALALPIESGRRKELLEELEEVQSELRQLRRDKKNEG